MADEKFTGIFYLVKKISDGHPCHLHIGRTTGGGAAVLFHWLVKLVNKSTSSKRHQNYPRQAWRRKIGIQAQLIKFVNFKYF